MSRSAWPETKTIFRKQRIEDQPDYLGNGLLNHPIQYDANPQRTLAAFTVIPVNSEIARTGGLFKRDFAKSHGVGLSDAIIAATRESNLTFYPCVAIK